MHVKCKSAYIEKKEFTLTQTLLLTFGILQICLEANQCNNKNFLTVLLNTWINVIHIKTEESDVLMTGC